MTGRRVETEADIGHSESGERSGNLGFDPADRIDSGHRIGAHVF